MAFALEKSCTAQHVPGPVLVDLPAGQAALVSCGRPSESEANEDAVGIWSNRTAAALLVVSDGMGGLRGGREASTAVIEKMSEALPHESGDDQDLRAAVVNGIESANRHLQETVAGSGATVVAALIGGNEARTIHAGDSQALLTGQRGKIKFLTPAHSQVGITEAIGLIDEEEALAHEDRNVINNYVGTPEMTLEIGTPVPLAVRDTLLVGSDGLFDNLRIAEIVELIRKGPLPKAAAALRDAALNRMATPGAGNPSKPDDLTFALYRCRSEGPR